MRKFHTISYLLLILIATFSFVAFAADPVTVNVNIPGLTDTAQKDPCGMVFGFYNFAMVFGGVLALGAITYGGVKYTMAAGNPSGQSEGKSWIKDALLGLLLLAGAYLILNIINPDLTKCGLPELEKLGAPPAVTTGGGSCAMYVQDTDVSIPPTCTDHTVTDSSQCNSSNSALCGGRPFISCRGVFGATCPASSALLNCIPTTAGQGTAKNRFDSPALSALLSGSCLPAAFKSSVSATYGGQHACNVTTGRASCHFGGSCNDGAHAVDFSRSGLASAGLTVPAAAAMLRLAVCPGITLIRCEKGSAPDPSCLIADHIHVNVANTSCNCN